VTPISGPVSVRAVGLVTARSLHWLEDFQGRSPWRPNAVCMCCTPSVPFAKILGFIDAMKRVQYFREFIR